MIVFHCFDSIKELVWERNKSSIVSALEGDNVDHTLLQRKDNNHFVWLETIDRYFPTVALRMTLGSIQVLIIAIRVAYGTYQCKSASSSSSSPIVSSEAFVLSCILLLELSFPSLFNERTREIDHSFVLTLYSRERKWRSTSRRKWVITNRWTTFDWPVIVR